MINVEPTYNRIIVSIDAKYKERTSFNGTTLNLKRNVNNFDKKYTAPTNAIVISHSELPVGAELLCHHNTHHDTYRIFNYEQISGDNISNETQVYSIPETEVYAWRKGNNEWQPMKGFEFSLRIFKPYTGFLTGIKPTLQKQKLFITTGEYKNTAIICARASDYEIVYNDENGKEQRLIRLRHFQEPNNIREEILGIDKQATRQILNNELLIGLNEFDAKTLNYE